VTGPEGREICNDETNRMLMEEGGCEDLGGLADLHVEPNVQLSTLLTHLL